MPRALRLVPGPSIPAEPPKNSHVTLGEETRSVLAAFIAGAVRLRGLEFQPTDATVARAKLMLPTLRRLLDELELRL